LRAEWVEFLILRIFVIGARTEDKASLIKDGFKSFMAAIGVENLDR